MKTVIFNQYQIDDGEVKSGTGQIDYDTSAEYAELFSTDSNLISDFKVAYQQRKKSKYTFYGESNELGINLMTQNLTSTQDGAHMTFRMWH